MAPMRFLTEPAAVAVITVAVLAAVGFSWLVQSNAAKARDTIARMEAAIAAGEPCGPGIAPLSQRGEVAVWICP